MAIMTMPKTAARPPKFERGKRRYTPLPDPPKKIDMVHREILTEVHSVIGNRYKRAPWTLVSGGCTCACAPATGAAGSSQTA